VHAEELQQDEEAALAEDGERKGRHGDVGLVERCTEIDLEVHEP
jgi:hypothetical protein